MNRPSVFVTGAAAGIGRATAQKFSREGWYVGAFDIDLAGVQALQQELGEAHCHAGALDVTDREAWDAALQDFLGQEASLNLLVNNAGVLDSGPFQDIAMASHERIVDINIKGVMNGCHAAFPWMQAVAGACIVNLASASAIYGTPMLASYAASKFAVRGLTEGLNLEWEPHDIRVIDIWPLFVQTAMVVGMKTDSIDRLGVNLRPEQVAETIWTAARSGSDRVHWTVGAQTAAFATLIRLLPAGLTRTVAKKLAG